MTNHRDLRVRTMQAAALVAGGLITIFCSGCASPPVAPGVPVGPTAVRTDTSYTYSAHSDDPDNDAYSLCCIFDWGDGTQDTTSFRVSADSFWSSHTWLFRGTASVKARTQLRNGTESEWSVPLQVEVEQASEATVLWSFGYASPDDPEDSADFSGSTISLAPNGTMAVSTEFGLVLRPKSGGAFAFTTQDLAAFAVAPVFDDSSYAYVGCLNDIFYCLKPNGTRRWCAQGNVSSPAALGADGAVFYQTSDSLVARNADGSRRWAVYTGGGSTQPVITRDGAVIAATDFADVLAFDQADGTPEWSQFYPGRSIFSPSAINPDRNELYVPLDDGSVAALNLGANGNQVWRATGLGVDPSGPVIGLDGTVYIGAGGKLIALDPANGTPKWTFDPPLAGTASTPAVSKTGTVCFVVGSSKRTKLAGPDSLYGVNSDGTRRWASGLGLGGRNRVMSAPKLGDNGFIYVGSGLRCWCVRGSDGPGVAAWPMYGHDACNSGRVGGP